MKIKDLYQTVVGIVCIETGIDEYNIIHSNKECCVDARYILVHILSHKLTDDEISLMMGIKRQSVNYIRNNFKCKLSKWSTREMLRDISKELAEDKHIDIILA